MGTPETGTRRLNIAQSFNPIGSIMGILMSKYFILADISLYSVSGTYAGLGVVLLCIMAVMFFANMPEGRDNSDGQGVISTFKRLSHNSTYLGGVVAQFFYVGAQIGVWSFTIRIVTQELNIAEAEASTIYLISIIGFCLSRFVYTWLMQWFRPVTLLQFGGIMSALCTAIVMATSGSGWLLIVALISISSFMSLMFPTIYGIALEHIATSEHPEDAKIGASGLIMAILGGAILTPVQGIISDATSIYTSYAMPLACFIVVTLYATCMSRKKGIINKE